MDQKDLEEYRKWFEITHEDRELETEELEALLDDIEEKLGYWNGIPEGFSRPGELPNPNDFETERYYQSLWRWKWDIERQLRNLIRGERDDLEWLGKLEGRQKARERAMGTEHAEEYGNGQQSGNRKPANAKRLRQHRKRASKTHNDVSGASPTHDPG